MLLILILQSVRRHLTWFLREPPRPNNSSNQCATHNTASIVVLRTCVGNVCQPHWTSERKCLYLDIFVINPHMLDPCLSNNTIAEKTGNLQCIPVIRNKYSHISIWNDDGPNSRAQHVQSKESGSCFVFPGVLVFKR